MGGALLLTGLLAALGDVGTATTTASAAPPRIDLISIGVGGEMYAIFGHAAIRVVHPDGRDVAYNFGGVDMEQEDFWLRVLQGRIEAYLDKTSYAELLLKYSGEDRTIVGRTLAFTPEQARRVVAELERIDGSDEDTYVYHYVYENCTTRVADIFDEVLGGELSKQGAFPLRDTHRDWILGHVRDKPGLYLAMDLAGNGMGDVPITGWDAVYIPEGFDRVIDRARIDGRPLVTDRYVDYTSMSFDDPIIWDWPWNKVYILFVAPLLLLGLWRPRLPAFAFGLVGGLVGWTLVVFWVASDYTFYHGNWNLVLFPPTHLAVAAAALSERAWRARWVSGYVTLHAALVLLVMLADVAGLVQQAIHPMLGVAVPLAGIVAWGRLRARPRATFAEAPLSVEI